MTLGVCFIWRIALGIPGPGGHSTFKICMTPAVLPPATVRSRTHVPDFQDVAGGMIEISRWIIIIALHGHIRIRRIANDHDLDAPHHAQELDGQARRGLAGAEP